MSSAIGSSTEGTTASEGAARGPCGGDFFICQRCLTPLDMNQSFETLNEHNLAELSLPTSTTPEYSLDPPKATPPDDMKETEGGSATPKFDAEAPRIELSEAGSKNAGNGFLLVNEEGETVSLTQKIAAQARLFDMISNNSEKVSRICFF